MSSAVSLVNRSSFGFLRLLSSFRTCSRNKTLAGTSSTRNASSWQYNQRNTTTFGGTTWQNHYASLYGNNSQRSHMLIDSQPMQADGGLLKIIVAILSSIYIGGKIAQKAATFLEENEIFVHTDDDDDD